MHVSISRMGRTNLRACIRVLISILPATPACCKHIVSISFCSSSLSEDNKASVYFLLNTDKDYHVPTTDTNSRMIINLKRTCKLATQELHRICAVTRLKRALHLLKINHKNLTWSPQNCYNQSNNKRAQIGLLTRIIPFSSCTMRRISAALLLAFSIATIYEFQTAFLALKKLQKKKKRTLQTLRFISFHKSHNVLRDFRRSSVNRPLQQLSTYDRKITLATKMSDELCPHNIGALYTFQLLSQKRSVKFKNLKLKRRSGQSLNNACNGTSMCETLVNPCTTEMPNARKFGPRVIHTYIDGINWFVQTRAPSMAHGNELNSRSSKRT